MNIGPVIPTRLMEFARIRDYFGCIEYLEKTAAKEKWAFSDTTCRPQREPWLPILESYLTFTFLRLATLYNAAQGEEKRLWFSKSNDGQECAFHTGLCTENYSGVFMIFSRNSNTQEKQQWEFTRFTHEEDYKMIQKYETLPRPAIYFTEKDKYLFDPEKELKVNLSHILSDENTIKRIPQTIRQNPMLISMILGAIEVAKKRVRYNYNFAILQYFNSELNWLLPLCLCAPDTAEVFLSVSAVDAKKNIGITILTPDMAYQNARLLAPVTSLWLNPA